MLEETIVASRLGRSLPVKQKKVWVVFFLCLVVSGAGVGLSFLVLGATFTGYRLWGVGTVLAIMMLGLSYGAKYANPNAREYFTPVDLIQYLSQGFLWPSTWPGLANFLGIPKIEPPVEGAALLLEFVQQAFMA